MLFKYSLKCEWINRKTIYTSPERKWHARFVTFLERFVDCLSREMDCSAEKKLYYFLPSLLSIAKKTKKKWAAAKQNKKERKRFSDKLQVNWKWKMERAKKEEKKQQKHNNIDAVTVEREKQEKYQMILYFFLFWQYFWAVFVLCRM